MTVHGWLRYSVIRQLIPPATRSVLEIGAGRGALGTLLARRFDYVGLEPDPVSFELAASLVGENGVVICAPEEDFEGTTFDLVCACEVLEHLADDVGAISRWRRHLRPGGSLIVSVPAGRSRFGPHDERQGHFRRYDRADVVRVLTAGGFDDIRVVNYAFPIGPVLYVPSNLLARVKPRAEKRAERTAESGRWMQPSRGGLQRAVAAPFALLQKPFANTDLGTGFVARARLGSR